MEAVFSSETVVECCRILCEFEICEFELESNPVIKTSVYTTPRL
jgi:hypothetical protein